MHLSRLLLHTAPEQRLPAMQQIATQQDVSVGTVQAAMQYLLSEQIVSVENRGRLGAFVQSLDYPRLWVLAQQRAMTAILPMPYSRHLEGLATGLRETFDRLSLDLALRFMRGSTARTERLHAQQCDWVVTSRYAAEAAWAHGFDTEIILALGEDTYTVNHVLVLNGHDRLLPDMRVGIDTHSSDHAYVVRQISRGTPVNMVEIDYSTGIDRLLLGEIDATVWTEQDLPVLPDHVQVRQVDDDLFEREHLQKLGEAVIIALPDAAPVAHILKATLDPDLLRATQRSVIAGQRRATY